MDTDEHALISDLLAEERLARAPGPEQVLDAVWARESDHARHERRAPRGARRRDAG